MTLSLKVTLTCNVWLNYFTLGYLFKKKKSKCLHNVVNESLWEHYYNSQRLEITQMSINTKPNCDISTQWYTIQQ